MNSKLTESLKSLNVAIESRHSGISGAMFILKNFASRLDKTVDLHVLAQLSWAQRTLWSERIEMEEIQDHSGLTGAEAEYLDSLVEVTSAISRLQFKVLDEPAPVGPTLRELFNTPREIGDNPNPQPKAE